MIITLPLQDILKRWKKHYSQIHISQGFFFFFAFELFIIIIIIIFFYTQIYDQFINIC
jgi:hypothetical protein